MDSDELIRRIRQSTPQQPETDWAGRRNPLSGQIENALTKSREASLGLSNRQRRRLERQQGGGSPERR